MALTVDIGWSWIVMVASSINNMVIFGVIKTGGVFYVALMKELEISRSEAALCSSLIYSLSCLFAPLSAYLCTKFSHKVLIFNGALLASIGMALAAIIPLSFPSVLIFYAIFTGVGLGFVLLPNLTAVHGYFNKHRTFAVGFSMAGASVGAFAIPPAFEIVLQKYNLQSAILVLSAFILHICPCGLLFRPQLNIKATKQKQQTETVSEENVILLTKNQQETSLMLTITKVASSCCKKQFLFIFYSYIMFAIVWSGYLTFLQVYALNETSDEVTPIMAVTVLSAMSSGDLLCRLVFGWISDRGWVQKQHAYTFFLAMCGITLISYTFTLSYTHLIILSVAFGIFISGVIVLPSVLLYDHCGPMKFQLMFGFTCFVNGIVSMLTVPTLAYIRELSGTYKTCFLIMGICIISSSLFWIIDEIYIKLFKVCKQDDQFINTNNMNEVVL